MFQIVHYVPFYLIKMYFCYKQTRYHDILLLITVILCQIGTNLLTFVSDYAIVFRIFTKRMEAQMNFQILDNKTMIDEIDIKLMKILNEDGKTPFSQIAQNLNVSNGVIRQCYQRLVREGKLQVEAISNTMLKGLSIMAQISVKVNHYRLQEIADQIAAFEETDYIIFSTNSFDLHIEVVCRDKHHLMEFLENKLHSVDGVKDTELKLLSTNALLKRFSPGQGIWA
jgi:Lrp/AsnC family transcriptional regulator for asnA, asnC and gidA